MRSAFVVVFFCAAKVALAQGMIFKWVDKQGVIHLTDRLGDVPEPYHSLYAVKLRELEARRKVAGNQPPAPRPAPSAPTPTPSPLAAELARQQEWKDTVAKWRRELEEATTEYENIHGELSEAQLNPVLRLTPEVQARITAIEARLADALARLERARHMLLSELPRKAKAEGVPPKWLL